MTTSIPPIVAEPPDEHREGERRKGWHTPETCFKLLDVQETMDSIFGQLAAGGERMNCIQSKLDENTAKTNDIYELLEMGRGFFKAIAFIGKWARRVVMWLGPPISVVLGIWYAIKPLK